MASRASARSDRPHPRTAGRRVDGAEPLCDARLPDRMRASCCWPARGARLHRPFAWNSQAMAALLPFPRVQEWCGGRSRAAGTPGLRPSQQSRCEPAALLLLPRSGSAGSGRPGCPAAAPCRHPDAALPCANTGDDRADPGSHHPNRPYSTRPAASAPDPIPEISPKVVPGPLTFIGRPERLSRGWSTRHSLACGCERVRGRPAYSCQGLSPGLGRRGASGAWFSARQARRRKLGTEPTDRPTSSGRGNHHSPLRDPAAAASRTAATAHDRVSHPTRADSASWRTSHPRKSSPAISTWIVLRPKARSSWAVWRRCSASGERSRPPEGAPRTTSIMSSRQRRSRVSERSCSRRISAIDRCQGRTRTRARPSPRPTASSPSSSRTR